MKKVTLEYEQDYQVSDESYEKICGIITDDKPKPKPEFEPKTICCVIIAAKGSRVRIKTHYDLTGDHTCVQNIAEAKRTIAALQSAIDFVEANK